jgi:hypothetical protein
MPVKKPIRSKTPVRVKSHQRRSPHVAHDVRESVQGSPSPQTSEGTASTKSWRGTGWIALALVSVVGAAVLMATPRPSRPANTAVADTKPESRASQPAAMRAGDVADPPKTAAVKTAAAAPAPVTAKSESTPRTLEPSVAAVTITGCLEQVDDAFRLKNTEGADAPKSRSWKSGFLKRASTRIDIVDASRRWNLAGHVGQRVSVTGTLVDREMHIQSLSRVSSTCTARSLAS